MAIFYLFFIVFLPFLSFLYLLPKYRENKSRCNPPGPLGLPLIGNLHQIEQSSLHTSFWNLSKSYGPIVYLNLGFIPSIIVSSASLAKEVMKTQDLIFCSRPSTIAQRKFTYDNIDVVFSPYNDYFKEMKKLVNVHVLGPKRIQHSRHIREVEVSLAMQTIHELALSSKHVNLSDITQTVMSTIMMRVGFGKRYEDGQERKKILGLIAGLQAMITNLFVSDLWPGLPFVGLIDKLTGQIDRLEKCFQDLDSFYQQLIDERLKTQNRKSHEDDQGNIIDVLIQLKNDRVFEFTNNHIKAILTDVLVAGTDASAATVIWGMTSLIKNPQVMKKAQEEVRNVVGKKSEVNEDDLPKLTYLKAVIKEIMRLYPPAPLLVPRETNKDTILHGYKIKQKTMVHINAWAIGRDPELWENPEDFLPERFLGSEVDFRGNDFELIPFGGGRRICPGISMGVMLAELFLANLVYLFDWRVLDGVKIEDIDYEVMPGITMHKKNDLCLLAHVYS